MSLALSLVSFAAALACGLIAWRITREERERSAARVAALQQAIDGDLPAVIATPGTTPAIASAPMVKLAALAVMVAVIAVAVVLQATGSNASGAAAMAPLELLSMRHATDRDGLTVSGLVRNPATGAPVEHLSAVVFAFDDQGNFISSGRAPIDFVSLGSGDESPFVVTIPRAGGVARYRVTFRTGTGVVRHLDKRG